MIDYDGTHVVIDGITSSHAMSILHNMGGHKTKEGAWELPGILATFKQLERRFQGSDLFELCTPRMLEFVVGTPKFPRYDYTEDLYPFQRKAIDFLVRSPHPGSMVCLSPGLGKTAVSIIASQLMGYKNVLVIAPLTLLRNWQKECMKWGQIDAKVYHNETPDDLSGWVIANYDSAWRHPEHYLNDYDLIIFDESVILKNRHAKKIRPLMSIAMNAYKVWMLSGSPITRFADDLYSQFKILMPKQFKSYWRFAEEYCIIERTVWGWTIIGTNKNIDLQDEFQDIIFVCSQSDVLELPPIIYETFELELTKTQQRLYDHVKKDFIAELVAGPVPVPNKVAQLTRLQQIVSNVATFDPGRPDDSTKMDTLIELIQTSYAKPPMIIWTHWKPTADLLVERLKQDPNLGTFEIIKAETNEVDRQSIVDRFQAGQIDILVLSLGIGKYGLTLTKANTVVYLDRWFDADALFQSSFRTQRIGQDHSVLCITLYCPGTVEDFVEENLSNKLSDIANLTDVDLLEMLRR